MLGDTVCGALAQCMARWGAGDASACAATGLPPKLWYVGDMRVCYVAGGPR